MAKVLIVGLDGATFDIIRPLAAQGRLPHLARLLAQGASGTLRSTIPPVTPAAWTSFFTGKNPGKHGIYDFQRLDFAETRFSTVRTDLHAEKTLWQLLGEAGLRSIVWDVPFTYPPAALPAGGWMLTGYGTPRVPGTVFTYPPDLARHIPEDLRPELRVALPESTFDRSRAFIAEFEAIMHGRRRLLNWLIREQAWDCFMVVFSITDTMAHVFWTYCDPGHPNYAHPEASVYREAFYEAYASCDAILGDLIAAAGPETTTLVLSDHGFGSVRPRQYIYRRLMQGGWVAPKGAGRRSPRARLARLLTDTYVRFPFLREWVKGLGAGSRRALTERLKGAGMLPTVEGLDLPASKVVPTNFGLRMWIHDRGRFPQGIIDPEQIEQTAAELSAFLLADIDARSRRPILQAVHRGADLYHGPFAFEGPDLVIEYANHFSFDAPVTADNPFTEGGHTLQGILLAGGPDVRPGEVDGAALIDLAPTVLHLLGRPVPPDMDGRVLTGLFSPEYLARCPVTAGSEPARNPTPVAGSGYSAAEEAELLEQLRKLGYV